MMLSNPDPFTTGDSLDVRSELAFAAARGAVAAQRQRRLAIATSIVASMMLFAGCLGDRWLESSNGTFGLFDYELCRRGDCGAGPLLDLIQSMNLETDRAIRAIAALPLHKQYAPPPRPPFVFAPAGIATGVSLGLGAAGLFVAAALALGRRRYDLPVAPTTVSLLGIGFGILTGCVFIATQPLKQEMLFGPGWTFWAFVAGAIGGLAATFWINHEIRPLDPEPPPETSLSWYQSTAPTAASASTYRSTQRERAATA